MYRISDTTSGDELLNWHRRKGKDFTYGNNIGNSEQEIILINMCLKCSVSKIHYCERLLAGVDDYNRISHVSATL